MPIGRCPGCGDRKPLFGGRCALCLARPNHGRSRGARRFGNAAPYVSPGAGKIAGPDFRLKWDRDSWLLEELPRTGKKRLRIDSMDGGGIRYGSVSVRMDAYIPENILRQAGVSASDTFEQVKHKIQAAMDAAANEVIAENGSKWDFLRHTKWNEKDVYFTEVMPEGMEPFDAKGKDFTVSVGWTKFQAYDPGSNFQSHDPTYTSYDSSAPAAARKLYQLLRKDPGALRDVSWSMFGPWLDKRKIGYKSHHSTYR